MTSRLSSFIVSVFLILFSSAYSHANVYTYVYDGQPFGINGQNLLPGATHISITFSVPSLLSPNTTYDVTSSPFQDLVMSDGVDSIPVGGGTFLSSSFINTNDVGAITTWEILELIGAGRTFVLGNQCCTIDDPPFLYTYCCSGPTDASIQTNGFFGIGPETDFAYNNGAPGVWAVPEPSTWVLMLFGFCALLLQSWVQDAWRAQAIKRWRPLGASHAPHG